MVEKALDAGSDFPEAAVEEVLGLPKHVQLGCSAQASEPGHKFGHRGHLILVALQ
jgi:hypothetical protein